MLQININELFAEFDKRCFDLCKEQRFNNEDSFIDCAIERCSIILWKVFDDDCLERRVKEHLHEYQYRDPQTDIQLSFIEWSKLFNSDEYDALDNITLLYNHCKELKKLLDECNKKNGKSPMITQENDSDTKRTIIESEPYCESSKVIPLSQSGLTHEEQNRICDIARQYINKILNWNHLMTWISSDPHDDLVYFESFNETTNCYEGQVEIYHIFMDKDGRFFIRFNDNDYYINS